MYRAHFSKRDKYRGDARCSLGTFDSSENWCTESLWNVVLRIRKFIDGGSIFRYEHSRFLIQWITSERENRSVIPEAFWYFSIAGGVIVLAYGVHRADPVIIIGQLTGVSIYSRNLYFIWRDKRHAARTSSSDTPAA